MCADVAGDEVQQRLRDSSEMMKTLSVSGSQQVGEGRRGWRATLPRREGYMSLMGVTAFRCSAHRIFEALDVMCRESDRRVGGRS